MGGYGRSKIGWLSASADGDLGRCGPECGIRDHRNVKNVPLPSPFLRRDSHEFNGAMACSSLPEESAIREGDSEEVAEAL